MTLLTLALCFQAADLDALVERYGQEKSHPAPRRERTIRSIGALKTDQAAGFLNESFDIETDNAVRGYLATALAETGVELAYLKLELLAPDTDLPLSIRITALEAVMKAGRPAGLEIARRVVREDNELKLRAYLLLEGYPLKDTERLWRRALNDDDAFVKGRALYVLAPLKDRTLIEAAKKAVADPLEEDYVRYGSVAVLRAAGGLQVTLILFAAVEESEDATFDRLVAQTVGSFKSESVAKEIYDKLRHKNPRVRAVAARALGTVDHKLTMRRLTGALRDRNPEVRIAAIEALAERKDPGSEKLLHREAQKAKGEPAAVAVGLLSEYPSKATRELLAKLAASYKPEVAIPALDTLAKIATPEDLPVFEKALSSKKWPIRVTAIRGLSGLKTKQSVDLLVDQMADESGRLRAECVDALKGMTGKSLGYVPEAWKAWWTANRAAFSFDAPAEAQAQGVGFTTYHGVPVLSERIVFCLDMSGSMAAEVDGGTRMEQAKREISRVLSSLGKDAQVNVLFFDDQIAPWQRKLTGIRSNLKRALAMVAKINPRGTTNIYDTLETAFQHKDVDTIYLLSDGDPTDGKIVSPVDILVSIRRINRVRQIVIHTISFGPSPFMKLLAQQNGGEYVEIK